MTSARRTPPQHQTSGGLAVATVMLAGAGLALWLFLAHLTNATLFQLAPDRALPGLIMLAVLPLLLNGFRRKVFFGTKLSLHQGISFEFIFQLVRWISPLLPSRRFQTAFQMRETGQDRALASSWQDIQAASFPDSIDQFAQRGDQPLLFQWNGVQTAGKSPGLGDGLIQQRHDA